MKLTGNTLILELIFFWSYTVTRLFGSSPSWLEKYIQFHNQEYMKNSSSYGYFVLQASNGHAGIADRIRPIIDMFRLARSLNRIFIYTWLPIMDLTQYLEPNLINWNLTESISNMPRENFRMVVNSIKSNLTTHHLSKVDRNKVIFISMKDSFPLIEGYGAIDDSPDIIHALFKPSASITNGVNQELINLKVDVNKPYVSLHLRMLHSVYNNGTLSIDNDKLFNPTEQELLDVQELLQCGSDISSLFLQSSDNPVVIVTDSTKIKEFIFANERNISTKFAISNQIPVHINKAKAHTELLSIFIDFFLIARSSYIISNDGRFGHVASKFGGNNYIRGKKGCRYIQTLYHFSDRAESHMV